MSALGLLVWCQATSGELPPESVPAPRPEAAQPFPPPAAELRENAALPPSIPASIRVRAAFVWRSQSGLPATTLTAEVDGERIGTVEGAEIEFSCSAAATSVRFAVRGFRDVVALLPIAGAERVDLGLLACDPDAAVVFAPPPHDALRVAVRLPDGVVWTSGAATAPDPVELAVPSGHRLTLSPTWLRADGALPCVAHSVALAPGERRRFELPFADTGALRLAGLSAELSERLQVLLSSAAAPDPSVMVAAVADADGLVRWCGPAGLWRASLSVTAGEPVPLVLASGAADLPVPGDLVEVLPAEPVVGLMLAPRGEEEFQLEMAERTSGAARCHVLPRAVATAMLPLAIATTAGRFEGWDAAVPADLWTIDPRRLVPHGVVRARAGPAAARVLQLLARPVGPGRPRPFARDGEQFSASLPAGDWQAIWRLRGGVVGDGPTPFTVVAGRSCEIIVAAPELQRWAVALRSAAAELPDTTGMHLRLGEVQAPAGAEASVFAIDLVQPPRVGDPAVLFSPVLQCEFAATVVAVDASSRRCELASEITAAVWTRIVGRPIGGGRVAIGARGVATARLPAAVQVPIARGGVWSGVVREQLEGLEQVTGWLQVAAGVDAVGEGRGRWVDVEFAVPFARATLAVRSGGGDEVRLGTVSTGAGQRVFLAEGTQELIVDLTPGGRRVVPCRGSVLVIR
ncbi:MAG: hypothetical protein IPK26_09360 [Planctomycetes bacterium]|nr:hypothetical protein [Planctomycetota bacterium]